MTVWCNEDSPVLWADILQALSGHDTTTALTSTDDLALSLMTADGAKRLQGYLTDHPPASDAQRRRVFAAFLEKFADPAAMQMEFAPPGWTQDMVDRMTETYDADLRTIAAIPGVRVIAP
jgi:hypothetical protein